MENKKIIWKDNALQNAQKIISHLTDLKQNQIKDHFNIWIRMLKKELALSGKVEFSENEIEFILTEMIKNNKTSISDFETIYFSNIKKFKKKIIKEYDLYIPYTFSLRKNIFNIFSTQFIMISKKRIIEEIGNESFIRSLESVSRHRSQKITIDNIPKKFLKVKSRGNNLNLAWEYIASHFDLLRGIIDFTISTDKMTWHFFTEGRRISRFSHPDWIIGVDTDKVEIANFVGYYRENPNWIRIDQGLIKRIDSKLKLFKEKPPDRSTLSLLSDSLRLYSFAMDAKHNFNCFLYLWQIAENICYSEEVGGNTQIIRNRLNDHVKQFLPINVEFTKGLQYLADLRNNIVHRGITKVNDLDLNILKMICEDALKWLFKEYKRIKSMNHLLEYYRLKTLNTKRLEAISDVAKILSN